MTKYKEHFVTAVSAHFIDYISNFLQQNEMLAEKQYYSIEPFSEPFEKVSGLFLTTCSKLAWHVSVI